MYYLYVPENMIKHPLQTIGQDFDSRKHSISPSLLVWGVRLKFRYSAEFPIANVPLQQGGHLLLPLLHGLITPAIDIAG